MLHLIGAVAAPLLKGLFDVVDQAVEDKDQAALIKSRLQQQVLAGQMKELEQAAKIIVAEAQSESWLARNWRPLTMVFFVAIIGAWWFGVTPERASEALMLELFGIVKLGLGGYVVGRSVEKGIRVWKEK
ncbi:MAG: 3TM-type holin [Rhodospirillales bacterium]